MKRKKMSPCNVELPMELVSEVLARLPVKSLLRFRCVCKSWHSLISSPDFASLHLARYHKDDDDENTPILTYTCPRKTGRWMLRSSHTFNKFKSRDCRNLQDKHFECLVGYFACGGSVNGLVLLLKHPLTSSGTEIMLWNPILGKSHKLRTLWIDGGEPSLGLGFTLSNNDHKVVAISKHGWYPSVHIYTLTTHTWRSIDNYKKTIVHDVYSHGLLVEEALFWVPLEKEGMQIVSFDVNDEVFDYITPPSADSGVFGRHPVAYRKCLGLLDVYSLSCNLWVIEKDHMSRTWCKLYTISLRPHTLLRIVCFKQNGQLIFASLERGMELCNFVTGQKKYLSKSFEFCCPPSFQYNFYCSVYKESLVLL